MGGAEYELRIRQGETRQEFIRRVVDDAGPLTAAARVRVRQLLPPVRAAATREAA